MTLSPIIFRKLERRDRERLVYVEEIVRGEVMEHSLRFDERTFSELERVFRTHPFPRKPAADDIVQFLSLDTPLGDPRKYLGLLIVNSGSRHHMRIEASEEAFAAMKAIFDSWCARFQTPNKAPEPTTRPVTIRAAARLAPGQVVAHL